MQGEHTVYAITGGSGFVGWRLVLRLLAENAQNYIVILDLGTPEYLEKTDVSDDDKNRLKSNDDKTRIYYRQCNIRSYDEVSAGLEPILINNHLCHVTTVFHVASYGMSGAELLNKQMIYEVNVIGTKNVIRVSQEKNISSLIYISTFNVVYGTVALANADETQDYFPLDQQRCMYCRTKTMAEQIVIEANNTSCNNNNKKLLTCSIRPGSIYGDGEKRHLPRILKHVSNGLAFFSVGEKNALCDWVYVDNLNHALILVDKKLKQSDKSLVAGQVYNITDDNPINNFDFLEKIIDGLGYPSTSYFVVRVPVSVMLGLAWILEHIAAYIKHTPLVGQTEVLKLALTNYANINKAKQHFAYKPLVSTDEAIRRCITSYKKQGYAYKKYTWSKRIAVFLIIIVILVYTFLL
ncbi:unnamed protein product [Didymodactylos carnosus]|uniref:3-beta hydroxysteroid dehydrogenase/isomerase domain-containing protein n=1 Tax=Didymodactylos carnosus TaxID=1234261 RepID=A0A814F9X4_9BILA|nr:unnamed protein product [Didymodactylos carnosus]CAF0977831.1 unnamed protein product [Didymodactylos carnosus]CAF3580814.1 unnamed protein product [Didymodactylos carnosus]CAF3750654.1 unnamed protein product [Didymodactylos carnosus]